MDVEPGPVSRSSESFGNPLDVLHEVVGDEETANEEEGVDVERSVQDVLVRETAVLFELGVGVICGKKNIEGSIPTAAHIFLPFFSKTSPTECWKSTCTW